MSAHPTPSRPVEWKPNGNGRKKKVNWSLIALTVAAVFFVIGQWVFSDRQAEIQRAVKATAKQAHANCVVVSVLLTNRADRDASVKLFEPIRRQNPAQFDRLVKRAEDGDKRLAKVQGDLACIAPQPPPLPSDQRLPQDLRNK